MNKSRFDEIVKNRANERVQKRIAQFKIDIKEAIRRLSPAVTSGYGAILWCGEKDEQPSTHKELTINRALVAYLQGRETTLPAVIWEREEEAVTAELLATMDEMQKALCAPEPSPDEAQPTPAP